MSAPASPTRERAGAPVGELLFAGGVAALGVFALLETSNIREPLSGSALGPRALPYIVGTMLVVLGLATLIAVLLGHRGEPELSEDLDTEAGTHWLSVGIIIGLFVLHAFLIVPLGWPLAAAVLFTGAAVTFGARPVWRAAVGGLVLAFLAQVVFAGLLSVSLPAGPFLQGVGVLGG